jgi:two-component system response regulator FixJ
MDVVSNAMAFDARRRQSDAVRGAIERGIARLTVRERQVLKAVVEGHPNRVIAQALGISPRTVEVYKARMMEKLQARSLADVIRIALEMPAG